MLTRSATLEDTRRSAPYLPNSATPLSALMCGACLSINQRAKPFQRWSNRMRMAKLGASDNRPA